MAIGSRFGGGTGALAAVAAATLASTASASLIGDQVEGVLNIDGFGTTNFFDPINGFVPPGANPLQPLAIVADPDVDYVEFMYANGHAGLDVDVDESSIWATEFPVSGDPGSNGLSGSTTSIGWTCPERSSA